MVNGINSQRFARNIAGVECWIQALKGPDGALMRSTRELFLGQMELHVLARVFNPEKTMVSLPDSFRSYNKVLMSCRGGREWPSRSSLCPYL